MLPIVLLCIAIIVFIIWFATTHSTHWRFNDDFVIGNTLENIIDKYGEPYHPKQIDNSEDYRFIAYKVGYTIMSDPIYYNIVFIDGVAVRVEESIGALIYGG